MDQVRADKPPVRTEEVSRFLAEQRLAFIGVSRDERDFSRAVFRELTSHGYDLVPVHPSAKEIEGRPAYASVADLPEPVGGALIMTPPEATLEVVRACIAAGIPRVWLHRGAGQGSVSEAAVELCRARDVSVVAGQCPLMFVGDSSVHRLHALGRMACGGYPAPRTLRRPERALLLMLLHLLVGVSALGGGGALVSDPSGGLVLMPSSHLSGTPFTSYFVPGMILTLIIGGSQLYAGLAHFARARLAPESSFVAGALLLGWMIVQLALIPGVAGIQVAMVAFAVAELSLALLLRLRTTPLLVIHGPVR